MPKNPPRQQVSILLRVSLDFAEKIEALATRWTEYLRANPYDAAERDRWERLMKMGREAKAGRATIVKEAMLAGLPKIEETLAHFEAGQVLNPPKKRKAP